MYIAYVLYSATTFYIAPVQYTVIPQGLEDEHVQQVINC